MMHFLFYTGSYRLLPSMHFAREIGVAYSIELFLGILPIMFIQILNHTQLEGELVPVQSIAMIIKLLSLLVFFVEGIIMIWEIILNRRMRKYKIEGFEKISEEERRSRYSKKYAGCGFLTFFVYFVILVFGMFAFESRNDLMKSLLIEAPGMNGTVGQTIEMGVIVNCTPGCNDCS